MRKINDFGEKIGGAKKDLWALFHELPEDQRSGMAQKDVLWKCKKSDLPEEVRFWQNAMRRAVRPRPASDPEGYVKFVLAFKEDVEACKTMEDIEGFYKSRVFSYMTCIGDHKWQYKEGYGRFFDGSKVLKYASSPELIRIDCKPKDQGRIMEVSDNIVSKPYGNGFWNKITFPHCMYSFYSDEELSDLAKGTGKLFIVIKKNRYQGAYDTKEAAEEAIKNKPSKEQFLPPHLENIERTGSDYRFFRMTDGNVLMSRYGIRGGEFGNWATAKDRLASINMCYDAFEDLADCLGISYKDISLGGSLAIAFGARGRGNALAHYEPVKNVINITRLRGAGSLAHEWGHALDMYAGNFNKYMSSQARGFDQGPAKELITAMVCTPDGEMTDYYRCSKKFDVMFRKDSNGYWASIHEMFARAFACYVKDKLGKDRSDYLVGHAECAVVKGICAYPVGEERKRINEKFDAFFEDMIAKGMLHAGHTEDKPRAEVQIISFFEGEGGQLRFC